jgi:hypothetical protein
MKRLKLTPARRKRFLEVLAETGNVTVAVRLSGTSRTRAYELRKADDEFAAAWGEAEEIAADRLEAEAWRRAVEGIAEPLVSAGKIVRDDDGQPIAIRRYSDNLLLALLKAHRPDKFRERRAIEPMGAPESDPPRMLAVSFVEPGKVVDAIPAKAGIRHR